METNGIAWYLISQTTLNLMGISIFALIFIVFFMALGWQADRQTIDELEETIKNLADGK